MKTIDIKTYSTQLHERLTARIESIAGENAEIIARSSKCLLAIKEVISDLKEFVYKYNFQNKGEEIEFFKETKPVFISQYYYYDKLIALKVSEPIADYERLKLYYGDKLRRLQSYIKDNLEFYTYCLSGSTYLDEQYFTREKTTFKAPDIDTRFSTGYDNTLSKILANQLVRDFVQSHVKNLGPDGRSSTLIWTAKKTYLVELIYALHKADAFNNGNVEIKQIATLFENQFNVTLGNFYRHFQEIALRKNSRTTFIDQLKQGLEQRFDEQP